MIVPPLPFLAIGAGLAPEDQLRVAIFYAYKACDCDGEALRQERRARFCIGGTQGDAATQGWQSCRRRKQILAAQHGGTSGIAYR